MAFASLDSLRYASPAPIRTQDQNAVRFGHLINASLWFYVRENGPENGLPSAHGPSAVPPLHRPKPSSKPLRVHHTSKSDPHRLALSGRLADVCAELDRLLEAEEA